MKVTNKRIIGYFIITNLLESLGSMKLKVTVALILIVFKWKTLNANLFIINRFEKQGKQPQFLIAAPNKVMNPYAADVNGWQLIFKTTVSRFHIYNFSQKLRY